MEGFVVAGAGAGRAWPFRSMTTKPAATTLVTTPNSKWAAPGPSRRR
jgi:hypothetical protein